MAVGPEKQTQPPATAMHVCPGCHEPFLQPAGWSQAGPHRWHVNLSCPNCDWNGDGVYPDVAIERFDRELDRAAEEILHDLEELSHSLMEEYIERFTAALEAGQILPEDF